MAVLVRYLSGKEAKLDADIFLQRQVDRDVIVDGLNQLRWVKLWDCYNHLEVHLDSESQHELRPNMWAIAG